MGACANGPNGRAGPSGEREGRRERTGWAGGGPSREEKEERVGRSCKPDGGSEGDEARVPFSI